MTGINGPQPILIVEDSDDDYEATVRALNSNDNLRNPIYRCESADEALDFLFLRGEFQDRSKYPRPGIVLLDLNMPGRDGRVVLEEMKADPKLKEIPVVVLTTSSDERDIHDCYAMGANTYVTKPVSLARFMDSVRRLKEFWFEVAILPKESSDENAS